VPLEGIIPALESSHALAYAAKLAPTLPKDKILLVNLSGRGDKDMHTVAEKSGITVLRSRNVTAVKNSPVFQAPAGARGRKALIPFITAGDPDPALTVPLMHALVEAGADIIELGVPFSDPMADGPTIQRASERALAQGHEPAPSARTGADFRADRTTTTPVVLMGYANPDRGHGRRAFAPRCRARPASMACWWSIIRPRKVRVLPRP
jgi:hypothetical protein